MANIYLVRHGESLTNTQKIFTGQINSPLTMLGNKQAEMVKNYFLDKNIDKIYSSDLLRCFETIAPTAKQKGLKIIPDKNFREIYSGLWQGMSFSDIEKTYPEDYKMWKTNLQNCTPTGGESIKNLSQRVYDGLKTIAQENSDKDVIICTHSVPIRAIVSIIKSGSFLEIGKSGWVPNGSVTSIGYDSGNFSVLSVGDSWHLGGYITQLPKNI